MISTGYSIGEPLAACRQDALAAGHRRLLCLFGSSEWCQEIGSALMGSDERTVCASGNWRGQLGQENSVAYIDGHVSPVPVNAMAALAGTLTPGGLLVLALPEKATTRFQRRLRSFVESDVTAIRMEQGGACFFPESEPSNWSGDFDFSEQSKAVDAIVRVATGHAKRPLVLTADRGRGKSASLGLAIAQLIANGYTHPIALIAARKAAVDSVYKHIGPDQERVSFYAPDKLLLDLPEAGLVLVDEAAQLPVTLLESIAARYSRVVFTTTVQGYEGSGRGFELRFQQRLAEIRPQFKRLKLEQPIRWRQGDPLEAWLNSVLLMTPNDAVAEASEVVATELVVEAQHRDDLLKNEIRLRQIAALLVNAHYQTTPADMQRLLDADDVKLWVARSGKRVVGVLMGQLEGGLDDIADDIQRGKRRLPGHLLPQTIAWQGNAGALACLKALRVVRIAVDENNRRHGVAAELLSVAEADAAVDYMGASFGANAALTQFWLAAGYRPVLLGSKPETNSGANALVVAKSLVGAASPFTENLSARFHRNLPLLLSRQFQNMEPLLAKLLLSSADSIEPEVLEQCQRYVNGETIYEHSEAELWQFCAQTEPSPLMIAKLLQAKSWQETGEQFGLKGRKATEKQLRSDLAAVIQNL